MDKDTFLLLLTKSLSGNATPEEEAALQQATTAQPDYQHLYELYKKYWQTHSPDQPAEVERALAATWQKIHAEEDMPSADTMPVEAPVKRIFSFPRIAAAAAILMVLTTTAWLLFRQREEAVKWVDTYNPKGIRSSILLPDGSKVWLAADSRLRYPRHFAAAQRDIYLEGEAFFEVTRNPQKPFEVHLTEGSVRVLGTSFDIRAYKEQSSIITSVATGKVAFLPGKDKEHRQVLLTPNHKSVYDIATGQTKVAETDALADKAWIEGILQFEAETLGAIALSLERYYGKTVVFKDETLKQYRYTGKFANSSASEVLQYLSKTKAFAFSVSDSVIVIGK